MTSWRAVALAVALVVALGAWLALRVGGGGGHDLKQELAEQSKDLRGRVDPLPQVRAAQPVRYRAGDLPDPFYPGESPAR